VLFLFNGTVTSQICARCDLVTITNHDAALERVARYVAYVREDARGAGCRSEPTNGPGARADLRGDSAVEQK
jgi:hypothetical protein